MKKISFKIMAGYIGILVLLSLVTFMNVSGMNDQEQKFKRLMEKRLKMAGYMEEIRYYITSEAFYLQGYLNNRDEHWYNKAIEQGKKAEEIAERLQPELTAQSGRDTLAQIRDLHKQYQDLGAQARELIQAGQEEEISAVLADEGKIFEELEKIGDFFVGMNEKAGQIAIESQVAEAQKLQQQAIIVSVMAIILGLVAGVLISRGISKPVLILSQALTKVAQGDLTIEKISLRSKDEIGSMVRDFNLMVDSLRGMIYQINSASQLVATTSEELSANAEEASKASQQVSITIEEVAKGSTEQSKGSSEVVTIMEQVIQAIHQIAAGADEQSRDVMDANALVEEMARKTDMMVHEMENVRELADKNGVVAVSGGHSVEKTVAGMLNVKEAVFETAHRIKELGEHSQKIGEIVQVIDEIAEQTNLLALNAAIEAARAGEQGKGFAVVADEVRKLAERSSKATKEIAELITDIQKGTRAAVESMEVGTKEVEEGVSLAEEAGQALQGIVAGVREVGENVNRIMSFINEVLSSSQEVARAVSNVAAITQQNTAATEEMSASAQQVNSSMQSVAAISEENAASTEQVSASTQILTASVEEISASSEQLAKMAQDLQGLVARFRL